MNDAVKERGIIFSSSMVRAIQRGTKTQTRRLVTPAPPAAVVGMESLDVPPFRGWRFVPVGRWPDDARYGHRSCPYGQPGERLYVKETWARWFGGTHARRLGQGVSFRADTCVPGTDREDADGVRAREDVGVTWRSARFMPRYASRIDLELLDVRAERLQDISEDDARAEGVTDKQVDLCLTMAESMGQREPMPARSWFSTEWDAINHKRAPFESNPWVWVITFRKLAP